MVRQIEYSKFQSRARLNELCDRTAGAVERQTAASGD